MTPRPLLSDQDIRHAAEQYAKQLEFERAQPPGPSFHFRQTHVMRGEGDGTTIYFGRHRGARYISVDLRGFSGWRNSRWMPGGWEFLNPTLSIGRLGMDCSRSWGREVLIPSKVWDFYYWRIRPSGRRYMREHGHEQPEAVAPGKEQGQ